MDGKVIIAILGSSAFSALVGGLVTYFTQKRRDKDNKNDMVLLLCASILTMLGEGSIQDGSIPFAKAKLFKNLYKMYKEFPDADGYIDLVNQKVTQLPLKED